MSQRERCANDWITSRLESPSSSENIGDRYSSKEYHHSGTCDKRYCPAPTMKTSDCPSQVGYTIPSSPSTYEEGSTDNRKACTSLEANALASDAGCCSQGDACLPLLRSASISAFCEGSGE